LVWLRRNSTGRSTSLATGGAAGVPCWVRLVRAGTTITAYQGADGVTWSRVANAKLLMSSQVTVGLAVSSSSGNSLLKTSFDNIRVVP
jgi:regulation of enolase protein 1 (concanavalin A-like superfamily)